MHRVVRKFLFAFFVAVFVVATPLVILYTAGYRLNITSRRVLQTGVIAITTSPRGASIYLDNTLINDKTPLVIQRLAPKTYELQFEKNGYHTWEQRVEVREGVTTYVTARLFAASEPTPLALSEARELLAEHDKDSQLPAIPDDIQLLDKRVQVEVWRQTDEESVLIGILPPGVYTLLYDDGEYLLFETESRAAFVVSRAGNNVTTLSPNMGAFSWLDDTHSLLWTDGTEVALFEASTGERLTITRLGEPIINVAWHPSGDTLFYATNRSLLAASREQYDTRPTTLLVDGVTINDFWLAENGKELYLATGPQAISTLSLTE